MNYMKPAANGAVLLGLSTFLSGCVALAVPLMAVTSVGAMGLTGFGMFKVVQTAGGGKVAVGFGSKDSKTIPPPQPLPLVRSIAIWPNTDREVFLAERLIASQRFKVTTPSAAARSLTSLTVDVDLKSKTVAEQSQDFDKLSRAVGADLVLAAKDIGMSVKGGFFQMKRGGFTTTSDLIGYSCRGRSVVWRDTMAVTQQTGSTIASDGEVAKIAGDAWAERILQAPSA